MPDPAILEPEDVESLCEIVRGSRRVKVRGGGSKPALSAGANVSLRRLEGGVQYDPAEYTLTALAGTPVALARALLAEEGQHLPFDPPLADRGATLGGTVAAGLSGPGRQRYGGVRDFLLGVRIVTGDGTLVRGGGQVVKNAAGFDLPKLMVGSLGRLGVVAEVTFKVFPRPEAYCTVTWEFASLSEALEAMRAVAASPLEAACLDLDSDRRLWIRVGGLASALPRRIERLAEVVGRAGDVVDGTGEEDLWRSVREFEWVPAGHELLKLPVTPTRIAVVDEACSGIPYRVSVGGHVAWLAWPAARAADELEGMLSTLRTPALALTGQWPPRLLGQTCGRAFAERLEAALDPESKFAPAGEGNRVTGERATGDRVTGDGVTGDGAAGESSTGATHAP